MNLSIRQTGSFAAVAHDGSISPRNRFRSPEKLGSGFFGGWNAPRNR